MARIRTIKPEFWTDFRLAQELSRDQRLLYIALWNDADDEGRFQAHPRRILGACFPYDDDLNERFIEDSLRALAQTGRVILYEVNGEPYGQLTKFREHQRVNRPTPSRLPGPDNNLARIIEPSVNPHGVHTEDSSPRARARDLDLELEMDDGVSDANASSSDSASPESDEPPIEEQLWTIWIEELGGPPPHPKLSPKRRKSLQLLYREQLRTDPDPLAAFRRICQAVRSSEHHMSTRAYQLPESLFLNAERRERWYLQAVNPSTPAGSEAVQDVLELLESAGSDLQFATTRELAFGRAEERCPDAWARTGSMFRKLDFPALLEVKRRGNLRDLEKTIREQLARIRRRA